MLNTKGQQKRARREVHDRLGRGHDLTKILADLQLRGHAPSRSTLYAWAKEYRDGKARDETGPWTLADDTIEQPEKVLCVLGALVNDAGLENTPPTITVRNARWIVRIASAAPHILGTRGMVRTPALDEHSPSVGTVPPEINLWLWALRYSAAETVGASEVAALDVALAWEYANGGRYMSDYFDSLTQKES